MIARLARKLRRLMVSERQSILIARSCLAEHRNVLVHDAARHADELALGALAELASSSLSMCSPEEQRQRGRDFNATRTNSVRNPPVPCCRWRGRAAGIGLPSASNCCATPMT